MIVKGCVIFERTLLSRKKSHDLPWSCAISNIFYYAFSKQPDQYTTNREFILIHVLYVYYLKSSGIENIKSFQKGTVIRITEPSPKEGAWSGLFSNRSKRSKYPLLEKVAWFRLLCLIYNYNHLSKNLNEKEKFLFLKTFNSTKKNLFFCPSMPKQPTKKVALLFDCSCYLLKWYIP